MGANSSHLLRPSVKSVQSVAKKRAWEHLLMKTIRAVCPHDCPDTCAMLVEVDDSGRAVRVKGDPEHAYTHGGLCVKVNHYEKRTYHKDRLLFPMKRTGRKGEGLFERISWDE